MNLDNIADIDALWDECQRGYIRATPHPHLPLTVWCYTHKAILEERWNPLTRMCRGMVTENSTLRVVAHCMPKFFNASEHINGKAYALPHTLPNEPKRIFAKVDGSLGTVFHYDGKWMVTTKGSFHAEQGEWAQRWLDSHNLTDLPTGNTYVTEIIYPQNRIVVDNGNTETLRLLTVFGPEGDEWDLNLYSGAWQAVGGSVVREYPMNISVSKLLYRSSRNHTLDGQPLTGTQSEGYVVRYASGLRVKIKNSDYIRLHGIITGLNERHVWHLLREGRSLASILDVLPDEYLDWVRKTADRLQDEFAAVAQDLLTTLCATGVPSDPRGLPDHIRTGTAGAAIRGLYDLLARETWDRIRPDATGPWKDHE